MSGRSLATRVLVAAAGAAAARAALHAVAAAPASSGLGRINFRGRPVTLAAGPAAAAAASLAAALGAGSPPAAAAALIAGAGSGAVGLYDDIVGGRPEQKAKGFAGHLAALRHGRVTSGLVKIVGVGTAGLAAAAVLASDRAVPRRRPGGTAGAAARTVDVLLGAGVIAGTANLVNLLDLRPGRALKATLLVGVPLVADRQGGIAAGAVGAAAGLLPADLDERVMLGDCGANGLGAVLGVALAARTGWRGRALILTAVGTLTAASEKVSFTEIIQRTPGLRELDALGRRPT